MATVDALKYELEGRLADLGTKKHLSVRYEPGPRIARVGVAIAEYSWAMRDRVIDVMLAFEDEHRDELAVEFDVIPLEAMNDVSFAQA